MREYFSIFKSVILSKSILSFAVLIFLIFPFTVGCQLKMPQKRKPLSFVSQSQNIDLKILNATANYYMGKGDQKNASNIFESIRSIYPFTTAAENASYQLMSIYINIGAKKSSELILVTEDYLSSYPKGNHREMASYLRTEGYELKMGKARDRKSIEESIIVCEDYIEEFGRSGKHSHEIEEKLSKLSGKLAFREIEIGNFYEKKQNYTSALVRYLDALKINEKNIHTAEILYRIYFCYKSIGLVQDAEIYYKRLKNEYSNTKWFEYALQIKSL